MSKHETTLKDLATGRRVPATIDDLLNLEALFAAEEQWCLGRIRVLRGLSAKALPREAWPESIHWSWAYKAASLGPTRLEALGDARLFGIHCSGEWQGLMLALSEGHFTRTNLLGQPLVYVDFLESAPWNWEITLIGQAGRYRGVGSQLMELAVRWSLSLEYGGRVALHALEQAEGFYSGHCGMRNLGPRTENGTVTEQKTGQSRLNTCTPYVFHHRGRLRRLRLRRSPRGRQAVAGHDLAWSGGPPGVAFGTAAVSRKD